MAASSASGSGSQPQQQQQQQVNHGELSASIRNRQRTFAPIKPRESAEHPLFKHSSTAKLFPALAKVADDEVAAMFGLPPIDKRELKQQYLIDHSDPFRDRPSVYHREGAARGESPVSSTHGGGGNNNTSTLNASGNSGGNNNASRGRSPADLARARATRPFTVSRHAVVVPTQSVFAGCNFEGDERREKKKTREQLYSKMKERGQPFVVRSNASRELERHEYVNSVDDDTLELLKEYMFSGRAAVDAAARKRTDVVEQRTAKRRQKGIRHQQQQHKLKQLRERGEVQYQ